DLPLRVELSAQFRDLTARGIKIGAECRQCLVMLNHAVADGLRERLQDAVRTAHDRAPQSRAWVTAFEQWGSAATLRSVVAGERIAFAIGRDFGGHDAASRCRMSALTERSAAVASVMLRPFKVRRSSSATNSEKAALNSRSASCCGPPLPRVS